MLLGFETYSLLYKLVILVLVNIQVVVVYKARLSGVRSPLKLLLYLSEVSTLAILLNFTLYDPLELFASSFDFIFEIFGYRLL